MMQYRPRTLGFYVIEGGEIGYLKLSQVSEGMTRRITQVDSTSVIQPVAWTISTGGSNNIHVHDNTISAVSNNEVGPMLARIPECIGLKTFGFAGLAI